MRSRFVQRYVDAGGDPAAAAEDHDAWLRDAYGQCLRAPGPGPIVAKDGLARAIEALRRAPRPDAEAWRTALGLAVDAYDALCMPFAPGDAERYGGSTSRQRLVDAVRRDELA